ncbi:CMP-N-acetylneuraminate-poly-alpha-2,8-sialyltransferase-like isoform X2 [Apostichopus japonicus]|uniref:CMP-N-acetylneuraminate-poly-alpha-2, 8-sialyltransferase-like isoform X2 n=1 Tax=Stichopus japonicus TaxID=307972 RepID=UPI003AB26EE6
MDLRWDQQRAAVLLQCGLNDNLLSKVVQRKVALGVAVIDVSDMECFQRDYTLIVYREHITDNPTFHQMNHFNVKNKTLMDYLVMSQESGRPDHAAGKKCYIKEIDSQYSTLKRQKKCAVIGNSGILLESKCGSTIDSYDLVIRANMAPVRGYENDVGNKTYLMLVNDEMLGILDTVLSSGPQTEREREIWRTLTSLNNTILWYPKDTSKHTTLLQNIAKALKKKKLHVQVAFSLKDIYSDVKWKYNLWRYPSSGLYMLAVAEAVCQSTAIFGFYPYEKDDFGKKVLRHYYEKNLTNFKTWARIIC